MGLLCSTSKPRRTMITRRDGTQAGVVDRMQTRDELYEVLDYLRSEQSL